MTQSSREIARASRGEPVASLRRHADEIRALKPAVGSEILDELSRDECHEARMIAGYALTWFLPACPKAAAELADRLVADDEWTVREAATFGVRDASVADAETGLPLLRAWAGAGEPRRHRAFMVAARQPARQRQDVVLKLIGLLREPLSDPDPYVRKNIPFAIRYIARTHPGVLVARLDDWAGSGDRGLEMAVLAALTTPGFVDTIAPPALKTLRDLLAASPHRATRSRSATLAP